MTELTIKEEYERCIMCGKLTCIPISMPIDWRENYEIGMGQVCAECAKKQREADERANTLSNAQIMLAVEQSRKKVKITRCRQAVIDKPILSPYVSEWVLYKGRKNERISIIDWTKVR